MKKLIAVFFIGLYMTSASFTQTSGTLSFSVTLSPHQGGYGSEHVVAIWIVDSANTFVKTNLRMAKSNHTINNHLNTWKASSNLNVVDAVTGATLTSYTTPISISWNGSDVNKNIVNDGNYTLWIEETWDEGTSSTSKTSITFKKSSDSVSYTPVNTSNFLSMSLKWVPIQIPSTISKVNSNNPEITIYPNPAYNILFINFSNLTGVKDINISDLKGKLVFREPIGKTIIGTKSINIQGLKTGVYLVSVKDINGRILINSKVLFSK